MRRTLATILLGCLIIATAGVPPACAADMVWTNAAGGEWNAADNWMGGVPGASDRALLSNSVASSYIVNYDIPMSAASISNLVVRNGGAGTNTLNINTNGFVVVNADAPYGSGPQIGTHGVINVNSGGVWVLKDTGASYPGLQFAGGTLNINGGTLSNLNGRIFNGNTIAAGTLNLYSGVLWGSDIYRADAGGVLNIYGGLMYGNSSFGLDIGRSAAAASTVNMTNGVLYAPNFVGIGEGGVGILNLSGGTVTSGFFVVGQAVDQHAKTSTVNQTGGALVNLGSLRLGSVQIEDGRSFNSPWTDTGIYSLSGGSVTNAGYLRVGFLYTTGTPGVVCNTNWGRLNISGGTWNQTGGTTNDGNLVNGAPLGQIAVSGGQITYYGNVSSYGWYTNSGTGVSEFRSTATLSNLTHAGGTIRVGTNGSVSLVGNAAAYTNHGTLEMRGGTLTAATINNPAGQRIDGNGLILGALNDSGTLAATIGGTLTVSNLTFNSGAILAWDFTEATQGLLRVTGNLSLPASMAVTVNRISGRVRPSGYLMIDCANAITNSLSGLVLTSGNTVGLSASGKQVFLYGPALGTMVTVK